MSVRSLSKETGTATSQSKSRIEQVLLAGLENERAKRVISPSKPIGLFGGVQRLTNQKSNHLLETVLRFRMYAAKVTTKNEMPFYEKATSYANAEGVYAEIAVGCYFRPNWHFEPDEVASLNLLAENKREAMTYVTLAGLRHAASTANYLFTKPLAGVLKWNQLASMVAGKLNAKVFTKKEDDPIVTIEKLRIRTTPVIPDAHLLVPGEAEKWMKANPEWVRQNSEVEVVGTKVEALGSSFLKFDELHNFHITKPEDDSMAHAMPDEFERYAAALFQDIKNDPHTFATVCMRGTSIELTFDQQVEGVLDNQDRKTMDNLTELFANVTSG